MGFLERFTRRFILLTSAVILAVFILSMIWDSRDFEKKPFSPKQIEIFDSTLMGYKDKVLTWRVHADYIWAGRSRYIYHAERISDGSIYNRQGKLILTNVSSGTLKVNTRHKTLKATSKVSGDFLRDDDEAPVQVSAGQFSYYDSTNRVVMDQDVTLIQGDVIIRPWDRFSIDIDEDVAMTEGGFSMVTDQFRVTGNQMEMILNESKAVLSGGVKGERFGRNFTDEPLDDREKELRRFTTYFQAEKVEILHNQYDDITMQGDVEIDQEDKQIRADYAHYKEITNEYFVEGNVRFESDELRWVVDKHKQDQFKNESVSSRIEKKTTITSDRIIFDGYGRLVKVVGNVRVIQEGMLISCQKLEYKDVSGELILIGNAVVERDEADTIRAERLVMVIDEETVMADGGVESTFYIE